MYVEELPETLYTTTKVKVKYDCCGKEYSLKWKDADKNYKKNGNKHICRQCSLRTNNPFQREDVKKKIKQTNLEKYGIENPANSEKNIAARREKIWND